MKHRRKGCRVKLLEHFHQGLDTVVCSGTLGYYAKANYTDWTVLPL